MERPLFHFTPPSAWLNDPNGMVYHDGEYHLFYQYHPASLIWGPMHWGHAVSRDLLSWEHLPIALEPDSIGAIFSGSAVVDRRNTAGFGAGALVAIFTHDAPGRQAQSLAFSLDRGRSWTKFAANPVLQPPAGVVDFRDPKVIWYGDERDGHWVMVLAVGQSIWFYTSPNLREWTKRGEFGASRGAHGGVWETPELVQLPVDGGPERRWVLVVAVQGGAPAGGSGTQYFVGDFDGATFSSQDDAERVRWMDCGADFYAPQLWSQAPGGRVMGLAWMSNWDYARQTPATVWRGAMTAPRELGLARDGDDVTLVQRPVAELEALRRDGWTEPALLVEGAAPLTAASAVCELVATLDLGATSARSAGIRIMAGPELVAAFRYDPGSRTLSFERHGIDVAGFDAPQAAPLTDCDGLLRLHLLIDRQSVELFANHGRLSLTNQIFPGAGPLSVELFAEGGVARFVDVAVYALGG